jgi:hypothetical protein
MESNFAASTRSSISMTTATPEAWQDNQDM